MVSQYQVEYKCNGIPNFFEFYLFVNPLGNKCYQCERELFETVDLISSKVDVHILPFYHQALVDDFIEQLNVPKNDLDTRNELYERVYLASLAYKAASLQGKRKGREFLSLMQETYANKIDHFTRDAVMQLAEAIGIDKAMFAEDLSSDFTRDLYMKDQRIAQEMNVLKTPALVIFEHQSGEDGIVLHNAITTENIMKEIDQLIMKQYQKISERSMRRNVRRQCAKVISLMRDHG